MTLGTKGRGCMAALWLVALLGPALAWGQVLTLTPSLTVGGRYDDNIFQSADNEVDDYITLISPAVELRYAPRNETLLTLAYQPAFHIFADHDRQNYDSHRINLALESPLSRRFSLELDDELLITEEPGDRLREVEDIGDNPDARPDSDQGRGRTLRNTATASLSATLAPRLSLGLLFESLIEDVEDNDELDEYRYLLGAEMAYLTHVARQNRATLTYTANFFTFSNNCSTREQTLGECTRREDDGFLVHTVMAGYEHNLSSTLSARVAIGYATTTSDRDEVDGNDFIVGGAGIMKTLRTGQLAFNYERSVTSGGGNADQVVADRFIGRIRFRPTPKITTSLSGSVAFLDHQNRHNNDRTFYVLRPSIEYQMLRFLGLHADYRIAWADYQEGNRADRTDQRFRGGLVFTVRTWLFIDLMYQYRDRAFDSAAENRERSEYTRNEVMLSVTYRPTLRF